MSSQHGPARTEDAVYRATNTTPWWKRAARPARRAFYRLGTLLENMLPRSAGPPMPPLHLRGYYNRTASRSAFAGYCEGARAELLTRGLRPEHRVLDIGCGVGNLALGLVDYLHGGYDGVDIHREAVEWCQASITPRYPTFRFHHADLASRAYNPGGRLSASAYRFPFPDRSFDVIFLSSVFTHLLPDTVEEYVHEISRLLAGGGICVASCYLINDESRPHVTAGRSFMSFGVSHPSGLCRLHDAAVPEAAVALEETFVRRIHEDAGLRIREVRRGEWWKGVPHHQDVLTVTRGGEAR